MPKQWLDALRDALAVMLFVWLGNQALAALGGKPPGDLLGRVLYLVGFCASACVCGGAPRPRFEHLGRVFLVVWIVAVVNLLIVFAQKGTFRADVALLTPAMLVLWVLIGGALSFAIVRAPVASESAGGG